MITMPESSWYQREDLTQLIDVLGGGEQARYVGGAVRDCLLGLPVNDIDIATILPPDEVICRAKAAGIKIIPTGITHGTVTAILSQGLAEITTLRRDIATDGRRATVAFTTDWQEDAARRDFTINALYADPNSRELFDYFNGLADLTERKVCFIGSPWERICEDHLRILRYFRFQARFGGKQADGEADAACAELAPTLKGISRERVGMELMKLLGTADPGPVITRMDQLGVLKVILPEANPAGLTALITEEIKQNIDADPLRRLAALIPPNPQLAWQVGARLRLSNAKRQRLISAAERSTQDEIDTCDDGRRLSYRLGSQTTLDLLLLSGKSVTALKSWEAPTFPLKGRTVVERGIKSGPIVSRILKKVEDRWVAEDFPGIERVEKLLEQVLTEEN